MNVFNKKKKTRKKGAKNCMRGGLLTTRMLQKLSAISDMMGTDLMIKL